MKHLVMPYKKLFETIRKDHNLSKVELAEKTGISRQYIDKLEKLNEPTNLTKETISKLQITYNVNPNYLLTGQGEMFLGIPTDTEIQQEITELAELMNKNPGIIGEIIVALIRETDLMSYAAKAINGDKKAREKFIKLTD